MIQDFIVDDALAFLISGVATQTDDAGVEVPVDIVGWTIKGTAIIDINKPELDIPIDGATVSPASQGNFAFFLSAVNKDLIFSTYLTKLGLNYEVKGHPPLATTPGLTLARGTLILRHSRELSKK